MTELEAINTMLRAIGQVPVRDISDSPTSDSNIAQQVLNEYTVELQTDGYDFNTDTKVVVSPNNSQKIFITSEVIRVWNYYNYPRLTVRNSRLYNLDDRTENFDQDQTINQIVSVPFVDLPPVLQRYVVIRAARVFGNRVVGAGEINAYNQEDESRARLAWLNALSEDMQLNVLSTSSHHRQPTFRPSHVLRRNSRYH